MENNFNKDVSVEIIKKKIKKGETNLKREVIIRKERNNFQKGQAI